MYRECAVIRERCSYRQTILLSGAGLMFELLNTLYVMTAGASLHLDHDAVRVVIEGETHLRAPLIRLGSIVVFGPVAVSPALIHRCADDGRTISFMSSNGRFKARLEGPLRGNVLLRRGQHLALDTPGWPSCIARQIVAAKIQNSRLVLLRGARETDGEPSKRLRQAADDLACSLTSIHSAEGLDYVRGVEGDAARIYFSVFDLLIRSGGEVFNFERRSRRPPRDRTNAMLSFLYALLREECTSALEGVGLDPQVGYLHALRPGRPALALDLMEELRPLAVDRFAVTLINRRQIGAADFDVREGGAVHLTGDGRRKVLSGYQERKKRTVRHRLLRQSVALGLVPHVQARLLARHLRRDLTHYPAYIAR